MPTGKTNQAKAVFPVPNCTSWGRIANPAVIVAAKTKQKPIETWCEASYVWLPREDLKMSQNLGPSNRWTPAWMPKRYRTRHCRA